ncbi:valine--tRNA ligase [Halalkalicoccus subterraneus]|uniref:valine--tRNA ligase n=1 Tax=Halalkalicoccus subterraneus TaxID=2675002 RepID=UPI000EFC1D4B|nr:valine--tRNA ligase [Halalkalicoccus subterraneus]
MDDSYDPGAVEPRWRERWAEEEVYRYEGDEQRPEYVIDTPPPYPTGNLHIGNALGWCYMDFAARFQRLQGKDVLYPQGWDCHGLPTEVKVEENHGIHRTDVSREEFRELCVEHTESQIDAMKETMGLLGFSQDWDHEFRTMDSSYWGKTQKSFVEMAEDDYVYRDEHPVNWCPRCETAIADAEVENEDRGGTLFTIRFDGADNDAIEIATTRPELLAACVAVAVDPDDERYEGRVGESFEVPIFGQEVELISDADVDSEFGTGAVMICTFGDKQDVDWWAEYDLPLRTVLTEDGRLNERAGEFEGLTVDEAKDEIASALQKGGYLQDEEPVEQSVGTCWRCDTPIEILSKEQWFIRVDGEEILEKAREIEWIPEHMYARLEEWTEGMEWDWVISRQRVFATPIPAWFCEECGHVHVAESEDLPVKPTSEDPEITCPECGAEDWTGETDVMDTWMDSSISALHVAGWPDEEFSPVQLREQGHDIIRTWAFYTILRTAALEDEIPWEQALINGMVFGEDGNKMSKSRGNFVQPEEVVEEHGADAFRQAIALGGQPGSDIQFQSKEVTSASRFLTKLWNISRFADGHLDEDTPTVDAPAYRDADRWILTELDSVARDVEADMEAYRFDAALRKIREFVWHDLADDYLELIKGRLYEGRPGERDAARHALYTTLSGSLRMLAPFSPFFTEELYRELPGTEGSVHVAGWPAVEADWNREEAITDGELIADAASTIRGWKSDSGMALNADLDRIELYADGEVEGLDTYDLSEAVNGPVYIEAGRPDVELVPVEVEPDQSVIGPEFRDRAGAVLGALSEADPAEIRAQRETGEIELDVDGETVTLSPEAVEIREERRAESGEEVAVLEAEHATVLVFP